MRDEARLRAYEQGFIYGVSGYMTEKQLKPLKYFNHGRKEKDGYEIVS